jgi:60 kDa SS-A/Ro ribonucleoprotein
MREVQKNNFGSTDCSAAIEYARKNRINADLFLVITDNETNNYHGRHASDALRQYRVAVNPKAKMIVAGMTATQSSIADPKDPGMLDLVGYDSSIPKIISEFVKM